MSDTVQPEFLRLITVLASCNTDGDPSVDDHRRWIEALRAIWKQQTSIALAFLAAINRAGIPNESPTELLSRSHKMAKDLLPDLKKQYAMKPREAAAQTNREKFLQQKAEFDPFLGDDTLLTADAFSCQGEPEPDVPTFVDKFGNMCR